METIIALVTVVLCFAFCIFALSFLLQLIGAGLGILRHKYLWLIALLGISIYVILMCKEDSWMWIFPKTLGVILDIGGSLFCLVAGIYLIWKTFTNWKFFLGMIALSTLVLGIAYLLN